MCSTIHTGSTSSNSGRLCLRLCLLLRQGGLCSSVVVGACADRELVGYTLLLNTRDHASAAYVRHVGLAARTRSGDLHGHAAHVNIGSSAGNSTAVGLVHEVGGVVVDVIVVVGRGCIGIEWRNDKVGGVRLILRMGMRVRVISSWGNVVVIVVVGVRDELLLHHTSTVAASRGNHLLLLVLLELLRGCATIAVTQHRGVRTTVGNDLIGLSLAGSGLGARSGVHNPSGAEHNAKGWWLVQVATSTGTCDDSARASDRSLRRDSCVDRTASIR